MPSEHGGVQVDAETIALLEGWVKTSPQARLKRRSRIILLLARGLSNKQIAHALVIAPKTAGNHIEHIYTKLGVTNRAGAAMHAMQHGLVGERSGDGPGDRGGIRSAP